MYLIVQTLFTDYIWYSVENDEMMTYVSSKHVSRIN